MNAQTLLAKHNISMDAANAWVAANIGNPKVIFDLCKSAGISTSMLTEIINHRFPNISEGAVRQFFGSQGFNMSFLDPITPTTSGVSVGEAAANELISAILHWQDDKNVYAEALEGAMGALSGFTLQTTQVGYQDLVNFKINMAMINSSQPGFVQMSLYGEHTWKLTRGEFIEMATELTESRFVSEAESADDVAEYASISDGLIPVYDQLVGQAPNYSSHWV